MKKYISKKLVIIAFILSIILSPLAMSITDPLMRPLVIKSFNLIKGKGFSESPQTEIIEDAKGIPYTIYPELGRQRNPVNIAQKGLEYWEKYEKNQEEFYKEKFINIADYLVNNLRVKDKFGVWEYNFFWESYSMTPPWISGMAQGLGLEVLGKAYKLTNNEKYLESANLVLNSFYKDTPEGVRVKLSKGWWYEEYVDEGGKNPRVLNGMIFAIEGLYNFYKDTGSSKALELFNKGILAVKENLYKYDGRGWSYYDILGKPASENYQKIHISQMQFLYNVTGEKIFLNYYNDWAQDYKSIFKPFICSFIFPPIAESDIVVLVSTILLTFLILLFLTQLILFIKNCKNKYLDF